jgi:DNA repair protein RecO (recombination protein O)
MPLDQTLMLRRFPFSESSLVVRVLSREHGRVHLLARGAYRMRSRYFALLDYFDTLELEWSARPERELGELRSGRLLWRRRGLPASLESYRAGLALLELSDLGSRPGQPDPALFDLLSHSLDRLDAGEGEPDWILVGFELGFLRVLGLEPALERCAACAAPGPLSAGSPARLAFSAGAGGRLCPACAAEARARGRRVGTLPQDVLACAARLLAGEEIPDPGASGEDLRLRVRDFVGRFLDYHLETRPRSHQAFLSAPNRNAPAGSS